MSESPLENPPPVSIGLAEKWARQHYGLIVQAEALPSYADENFRLEDAEGQRWVLKIAGPNNSHQGLDFQNRAMLHVAAAMPQGTICQPIASLSGEKLLRVTDLNEQERWLRLLTWVPGRPLAQVGSPSADVLREIGSFVGRMDRSLMDFGHPGARQEMIWDLRHVQEVASLTPCIEDSRLRAIAEHFLNRLEFGTVARLLPLRRSILHNDANDYNLMVERSSSGEVRLSGLIDFGDLVASHTVCELAITAAYALMYQDSFQALAPLVEGYHREMPLSAEEIDLLYDLIAGRLVTSVAKSSHGIQQTPENTYLVISQQPAWRALELLMGTDPMEATNLLLRACGFEVRPSRHAAAEDLLPRRRRHVGPNLSLAYGEPLTLLRGSRQYLFDASGSAFIDLVNNVCHVGHAHPRVVRAIAQQAASLNTNTRYLHPLLIDYVERLTATLPEHLSVVYLCCTGSEANDLALRLARNFTSRRDLVVLDAAYHGHTAALIEASPYKFNAPGGQGRSPHVHVAPCPDVYRGPHRQGDAAKRYVATVRDALDAATVHGGAAAFIAESLLGCGGQIEPPASYLKEAFEAAREAGAVCIADEVQVGFGRVGSHFWAFEAQNAKPDIVTLGKPIGNGHPLSAVITTREIAQAFDNGMEYFNTFGGNPVSCAAGLAVLDVIRDEGLQDNARDVGAHLLEELEHLKRHALVGDVRGRGLFLGVEMVRDRETLQPAAEEAATVIESMKERGILLSTDGPLHNVLKIKPPLVVTRQDADRVVQRLDEILASPRVLQAPREAKKS